MSALQKKVLQGRMAAHSTLQFSKADHKQMEGNQSLHPTLAQTDKLIDSLRSILPQVPLVLSVPSKTPYRPTFPHENINSPFEPHEQDLQYMTLWQDGHRGVAVATANWQEDIDGTIPNSPNMRSSNGTPNSKEAKKPSQRMTISDYRKFKESGVTPTLKPIIPTSETSSIQGDSRTHEGRTSSLSTHDLAKDTQPDSKRDSRVETNTDSSMRVDRADATDDKLLDKRPESNNADRPRPIAYDKAELPLEAKITKPIHTSKKHSPVRDNAENGPLPRLHSPINATTESKLQKRPREHEVLPSEKRMKTDSAKALSREPVITGLDVEAAAKPVQSNAVMSNGVKPIVKPSGPKLPVKSVDETAAKLPPFQSPLSRDLAAYVDQTEPEASQANGDNPINQTVYGHKIRASKTRADVPNSSPLSTPPDSSPARLIISFEMLSPTLPEHIEEDLRKVIAEHGRTTPLVTTGGRHDKARQPDTPGVARKVKVGHPPKRKSDESGSTIISRDPSRGPVERKKSLIVKIPIKKRQRLDIKRILQMPSKPTKEFRKLEAERLSSMQGSIVVAHPMTTTTRLPADDSDDDLRRAISTKKRPNPNLTPEPAVKRARVPKGIDVPKASTPAPAFKSPVTSAPTPQKALNTPKKADPVKSAVMRRIDSSESYNAGSPQTNMTSTPASAEKPRANGDFHRPSPELEHFAHDYEKYNNLARALKHARDPILRDVPSTEPDYETLRLRATCIGLESLISWMVAFGAQDRINAIKGKRDASTWDSLIRYLRDLEKHAAKEEVLNAIMTNLAALCCEMYVKQLLGLVSGDAKAILEKIKETERNRAKYWKRAHQEDKHFILQLLDDRRAEAQLGPWITDMTYAAHWAIAILEKWEARRKCGWKKELDI